MKYTKRSLESYTIISLVLCIRTAGSCDYFVVHYSLNPSCKKMVNLFSRTISYFLLNLILKGNFRVESLSSSLLYLLQTH